MLTPFISRVILLLFGALYPAYASFKAVRYKLSREYVKWMMYWIVFACYLAIESIADTFLFWLPFYYEAKILFILYLMLPFTRGASLLYRKCLHPYLIEREEHIDAMLNEAQARGLHLVRDVGLKGLQAANQAVLTALDSGLRRTVSMPELPPKNDPDPDANAELAEKLPSVPEDDVSPDPEENVPATDRRRRSESAATNEGEVDSTSGNDVSSTRALRSRKKKKVVEPMLAS